jgi:hypothetical protein
VNKRTCQAIASSLTLTLRYFLDMVNDGLTVGKIQIIEFVVLMTSVGG